MQKYRLKLVAVWLAGGGLVALTMILQSTLGHYGEGAQGAWEWLLPNLMPTMALVVSVSALTKPAETAVPEGVRSLYVMAMAGSIFYLLALALPIFLQPLVGGSPLTLLRQSNLWLGPLQGVVGSLLGVFFAKETPKAK